tara:strand:+ start:280 stop:579 length:300 start_codon:yes stop_codon:yes gene_type:complete
MDIAELSKVLDRMKYAINHREEMINNSEIWKAIEKYKIKSPYNLELFNLDCGNIKQFHKKGYDLYNRDFLKIKLDESICAVANTLSGSLKFTLKSLHKL